MYPVNIPFTFSSHWYALNIRVTFTLHSLHSHFTSTKFSLHVNIRSTRHAVDMHLTCPTRPLHIHFTSTWHALHIYLTSTSNLFHIYFTHIPCTKYALVMKPAGFPCAVQVRFLSSVSGLRIQEHLRRTRKCPSLRLLLQHWSKPRANQITGLR